MYRILFLLIFITNIKAQNPFFNDPVISGTPLLPSNEVILEYGKRNRQLVEHSFKATYGILEKTLQNEGII